MHLAENPFPEPSPLTYQRICEQVALASYVYQKGWVLGTSGNFSVRDASRTDIVWMSPSGVSKGAMSPEQFVPVRLQDASVISPASGKASAESPLHCAVFRHVGDARAVVHCHMPSLVRASMQTNIDILTFSGWEMQKAFGLSSHETKLAIPIIANTQDMHALAKEFEFLKSPSAQIPLFILRGHGCYAWGKEPQDAVNYLEAIEFLCQTAV